MQPSIDEKKRTLERRWSALPAWLRAGITVIIYVASYLLLDWAAQAFTPESEVAVWFPAAALNIVLLWVFGLRYAPAVFAAVFISEVPTRFELAVPLMIVYGFVQTLGYLGVVLVLRKLGINPRLYTLRDISYFLLAITFLPLFFVAFSSVTTLAAAGVVPWAQWPLQVMQFWAGDATGIGLLAPPLLIVLRLTPWLQVDSYTQRAVELRSPTRREWWRGAGLLVAIVLGIALAYVGQRGLDLNRDYLAFVPLIAVAVFYGFEISAFAVLVANIAVAFIVGPSFDSSDGLSLQFGLMTLTLVSLMLGAITSARQATQRQLRHRTLHDPLTGLPNRELLLERLEEIRDERALLLLNLDNFQNINDSLGHSFGDALLCAVAERLKGGLTPEDTLAHLSGDEFALLLSSEEVHRLEEVSGRVRESFAQPFRVGGREQRLSVGIGIALSDDGDEAPAPTELLRRAHTALHRAKQGGGGRSVRFEKPMHAQAVERLELENDLRRALEHQEFVIHYQPIWSLQTGRIVQAEALLRWLHPERGLIPPATFIPLAEATGLIEPLSCWLMRSAFKQAKTWARAGQPLSVAVNVSAVQVQTLEDALDDALAVSGLGAEYVKLEVTESLFLEPLENTVALLRALAERGIHVSIDDFGTGYASLSYLKNLPIHALKIDRSFLKGVPDNAGDIAIVETILFMADTLGLEVIAEGVETKAQLDFLLKQNCPYAQGYYLARAMSAAAFTATLGRSLLDPK